MFKDLFDSRVSGYPRKVWGGAMGPFFGPDYGAQRTRSTLQFIG